VGDNNFGNLYLFEMNPARDGFILSGAVADKVADSSTERNLNVIGTGWGVTTDMEIGPDGYIYVVNLAGGNIRRIRPTAENLGPESFTVNPGVIAGGNLASLQESDDSRLTMRPGIVFTTSQPPIALFAETTSPFAVPSQLTVSIESRGSSPNIQQIIALENDGGVFEVLYQRQVTTKDDTITINIVSNPADYVRNDGSIRARVQYRVTGPVFVFPWTAEVDRVRFTANQ
jgi:hypothetical protein